MIAEREYSNPAVVRAGVSDEDLARIVALAGFGATGRGEASTLAADGHPVAVAARLEASATTLRATLVLLAMIVLGGVATLLV